MNRNLDWSPLEWSVDPVPGNPGYVASQSASMRTSADAMHSAARNLRRLEAPSTCSEAVAKIMVESSKVAELLDEAGHRYDSVASALSTFAPILKHAQDESLAALQQAAVHQGDERAAYKQSVSLYWQAKASIDPAERDHLITKYKQVSARQKTAGMSLEAARSRLREAIKERDGAAVRAADAVNEASSVGKLNDSAWDKFDAFVQPLVDFVDSAGKWIWEHIDAIALVLTVLAFAFSWVPGLNVVLSALAMGARVLALAKASYEFGGALATGVQTGNWGDAVIKGAGVAMSLIGLRSAGKVAGMVMPKATKVMNAMRNTYASALRRSATARYNHLQQLIIKSHNDAGTTAARALNGARTTPLYHRAAGEVDRIHHAANAAVREQGAKTSAALATVKGTDLSPEIHAAAKDLARLGKVHDIPDAFVKDAISIASTNAEEAVFDIAGRVVTAAVEHDVGQIESALESHRVGVTPCGAR